MADTNISRGNPVKTSQPGANQTGAGGEYPFGPFWILGRVSR
jgi:hypothetical protein